MVWGYVFGINLRQTACGREQFGVGCGRIFEEGENALGVALREVNMIGILNRFLGGTDRVFQDEIG